jgi:hypothetical protein
MCVYQFRHLGTASEPARALAAACLPLLVQRSRNYSGVRNGCQQAGRIFSTNRKTPPSIPENRLPANPPRPIAALWRKMLVIESIAVFFHAIVSLYIKAPVCP